MKILLMIFALSLCLPRFSPAQSPPEKKTSKSKLNTNLFEKTDSEDSLSGKVKAIREVQEETEVFIEAKGNNGPYVLPQGLKDRAKMLKSLQKSLKAGGPAVVIGIDDQQRIKSVEESEGSSHSQPGW